MTRPFILIVFGMLLAAGGALAQDICGTWNHSPTPNPNELFSQLRGVAAISAADVWAVGQYDSLAGTYTPLLRAVTAHWNGSSWSVVPTPAVGPSGTTLTGVAADGPSDVWAVGYSSTYGTPQTLVQRWDGAQWSVVPSPVISGGSSLEAVTLVSANDAWAVGNRAGGLPDYSATVVTLAVHWNGAAWVAVPSPNVSNRWNDLASVSAVSSDDVWAVGSSRNIGELYQNLAMHWNGAGWTVVPTPNAANSENELYAVAAIASDDVWAVGRSNDGISERSVYLHWNGAAWSSVPGPGGGEAVTGSGALVVLASDDVWAVGNTVAHWDGSSWSLAPNPVVPGAPGLSLVGASKVGACDVWAVGVSYDTDAQHTLAVHLTAGGGTVNQPPVAIASGEPLHGLAPLTVRLVSAGSHDTDGTIVSRLWDFGDSTYPPERTEADPEHTYVQTGPLTYHAVVHVIDDQGAAATSSVTIQIDMSVHVQSQSVSRIEQGAGWAGEDVVFVADANGLPVADATVTASFTGPTGGGTSAVTNAEGIAVLRTTASGTPASDWCFSVTDVARTGTGYVPASNVVTTRCESSGTSDTPPGGQPATFELAAGPNPFSRGVALRLVLPAAATVSVRVLDAAGRLVRDLLREDLAAGGHVLRWDGRDGGGDPAPAGLFFVRVSCGNELRTVRLLRLR